jgi:hypothetical protein
MGANSSVGYGWIQSANWGSGYIATAINPNGGNVGIGTSSPGAILDVKVASDAKLLVQDGNTTGNVKLNAVNNAVSANVNLEISASNTQFFNGGSEKARIDSSGRLLVGTSSTVSAAGADAIQQIHSNNYMQLALINNVNAAGGCGLALGHSRGASAGTFNLLNDGDEFGAIYFVGADGTDLTTQGATIRAEVDGTPGANDMPGRLVFATTADGAASPTERLRIQSDGILIKYGDTTSARIQPQTDNAGFLGEATKRWEAVYAVNGTIQTSDVREKTDIVDSPLGAEFIRSLRPVAYRWKVGGYTSTYDDKGNETITPNPGVRAHYGFIAQEVKQAIGETDFGGWLQEDLSDPDSQQSLRLHEFISPIVKALQEALDEIDNLKAEVAALKAQ